MELLCLFRFTQLFIKRHKTIKLELILLLVFVPHIAAHAACTSPAGVAGEMGFNLTGTSEQEYCNGTNWISMDANAASGLPATVGHWKLDETSGTTATDSSASGNNGTMTSMDGASNTVSGKVGTALSFSSSSRITAGAAATNFDDAFAGGGSIAYWVYPINWGTYGRVIDKSDSGTFPPNSGWHSQGTTGIIKFSHAFSTTEGDWQSPASSVPMNMWSHILITYDSDSSANTPSIYVNGSSVSVTTATAPSGTAVSDAANPVTLGSRQGGGNNFTGYADGIQMYSSILSAANIQEVYEQSYSRKMVGHWKLNETSGLTATDSSGYGNDGTLTNMDGATDWVDGKDGKGLDFDKSANQEVGATATGLVDEISVGAWVNARSIPSAGGKIVCEGSCDSSSSIAYRLNVYPSGTQFNFFIHQV